MYDPDIIALWPVTIWIICRTVVFGITTLRPSPVYINQLTVNPAQTAAKGDINTIGTH